MGQLYVLKLQSDKWYVGYTDRGIVRVLEHLQNAGKFKAAKWTQKYRPINWEDAVVEVTGGNKTLEDEDNKTLELMAIHGVENVRGGKWCKVNMTKREIEKLRKMSRKIKPKKTSRKITCGRCGRLGHNRTQCYAKTTIDGVKITTKSWRYSREKSNSPPSKVNNRPRRSRRKTRASDITTATDALRKRGVFCEDRNMNLNVRGMWGIFTKYSDSSELSDPKWYEILKNNHSKFGRRPLVTLYPPEHWFHNPELFDEKLSKEFENDGYLWTASGAAVNPKIRSLQLLEIERLREEKRALMEKQRLEKEKVREQRILEKEKAREQRRIQLEERQKEIEKQKELERRQLEEEEAAKEKHRTECIAKLRERGILIERSMAATEQSFVRALRSGSKNNESMAKWMDFFNSISKGFDLIPLYPMDHWLHEPDKFDSSLSAEFEYDGFGWTESGFAAIHPNPSKKSQSKSDTDDSTTDGIDIVFESIAKEIEKAGKSVRKELGKLKREFRKKTGL